MDDNRNTIATQALPKLEALVRNEFMEWFSLTESYVEEFFYDAKTHDVYAALTLQFSLQGELQERTFCACISVDGLITSIEVADLISKDLEDISHLPLSVVQKILNDIRSQKAIKAILLASVTMTKQTDICLAH